MLKGTAVGVALVHVHVVHTHPGGVSGAEDVKTLDPAQESVEFADEVVAALERPATGTGNANMSDVIERTGCRYLCQLVQPIVERADVGPQGFVDAELSAAILDLHLGEG